MAQMTPELTVHMLPYRYEAFGKVLNGEEHGFGQRTLTLEMVSGQDNLDVELPVLCRYKDNVPILSTIRDRDNRMLLCNIVRSDGSVKVVFDDGTPDHLAKLTGCGAKPSSDGGAEVRFNWEEADDAMLLLEKSVRWLRRKLNKKIMA